MRREHCEAAGSLTYFTTGNYRIATTAQIEWWFVVSPETGRAVLGLKEWPPENRWSDPKHQRSARPLSAYDGQWREVNRQLLDRGSPPLTEEEFIGLRLCTTSHPCHQPCSLALLAHNLTRPVVSASVCQTLDPCLFVTTPSCEVLALRCHPQGGV